MQALVTAYVTPAAVIALTNPVSRVSVINTKIKFKKKPFVVSRNLKVVQK